MIAEIIYTHYTETYSVVRYGHALVDSFPRHSEKYSKPSDIAIVGFTIFSLNFAVSQKKIQKRVPIPKFETCNKNKPLVEPLINEFSYRLTSLYILLVLQCISCMSVVFTEAG